MIFKTSSMDGGKMDYEYDDITLDDVLTIEEKEAFRQQAYDDYYNAPLSSNSLGLWDSDFF